MDKKETIKNIINSNGGIAKTADFVAEGLTNYDVANLCKEGYIERVRHGYYQLAEQEDIKEEQVLASLLPESIVCVESALFYYGYSDFSPRQWSIAVPRTFSRTRLHIDSLATRVYFVQPTLFEIGKTSGDFNGGVAGWLICRFRACTAGKNKHKKPLAMELLPTAKGFLL